MTEHVLLTTFDGVEIVGMYQPGEGKKFAILLHMMPATKESWLPWMEKLAERGYASLAIDERGHGESTMNGTLDYKTFGEEEQKAKIYDVDAAFSYLRAEGATEESVILIGASIGANLGIQFASAHPNIPLVIALSPGVNYRGVQTESAIQHLSPGQKVILVASDDDDRNATESCRRLHELNPAQTELVQKSGLGHGTTMSEKNPTLIDELFAYLP